MTKDQENLLAYTRKKVKVLFRDYPIPAHGFSHSERVRKWAEEVAAGEKQNIFLCSLAATLHDIGRTREMTGFGSRHHELSYEMMREWYKKDSAFDILTKQEKIIVLYAIRYHWNNAANKYPEAIILRDADKLDSLGKIGVKRTQEFYSNEAGKIEQDFRLKYDMLYWLETKTAWEIVWKKKIMLPVDRYYLALLKKEILPIEL